MHLGGELVKRLYLLFLALILIFCTGGDEFSTSVLYTYNVDAIENISKSVLQFNNVIYTKVPRGLIISFDEGVFFTEREARIKESSLPLLNQIAQILTQLPNNCVIENHTEEKGGQTDEYKETWELSTARAINIAEYLSKYCNISAQRLFALGFGEYMPFSDNVAPKIHLNNRVDFVIIEYEAKR
jgi:chemotaxis protein MotB